MRSFIPLSAKACDVSRGLAMPCRALLRGVGMACLVVVLSACVLSVEPVVPESAATFDARLLGAWQADDASDRAVVSRAAGNTYAIEYTSNHHVGRFEGRLGQLGARVVLDVWPVPRDGEIARPYDDVLLPVHFLLVLDIGADEVRTRTLDHAALLATLDAGQVGLAHGETRSKLVLHGNTEPLRAALGPYLEHPGALAEPALWRRAGDATTATPVPVAEPCFEASAWPEADALFHRDAHWVGADGASSVDLGGGRTLWLFGDTWIDPSGQATRQDARLIGNSVAIQSGADPSTASIRFYWGHAADGSPAAFVPDQGDERHWFGNGVRVGDRLLLLLNRVRHAEGGLGFAAVGWTAWMVDNPDDQPSAWRMRELKTPENALGVLVGFGAVLQRDGYVYAFGSADPVASHPVYGVRWSANQVHDGDLLAPEWWVDERLGWVLDASKAPRWPLFDEGQSELSIHWDQAAQKFLAVHTQGFGAADVVVRSAPSLTGPWSAPRMLYRPSEYSRANTTIYSAKAHPELAGADLVLTYATNSFQFSDMVSDDSIYFPRFVRLARCP